MKKLKLDLDQIQVTSFSTQLTHGGGRGTVEGLEQEATIHLNCSEGCIPSDETPAYSLICDGGVFTWGTCGGFLSCAQYTCQNEVS
jgi:hypothetical protein